MKIKENLIKTDILIVGSAAGIRAAIEIAGEQNLEVTIAVKGKLGRSGATPMAGADLTIDGESACKLGFPGNPNDKPINFAEDIVTEGLFLNNQKLVKDYTSHAGEAIKDIIEWGMNVKSFERAHGEESPRGIITTGIQICNALLRRLKKCDRVQVLNYTMIVDLIVKNNRITGALGIDLRTGEVIIFKCKAVILATGGWHKLYPFTSGSSDLTGDGHGMAFRAGAELIDMEMVQFCPNIIISPKLFKGALFLYWPLGEYVTGHLLNSRGERFLRKWDDERMENNTKEIVSLATAYEIINGRGSPSGGVYYSLNHLPKDIFKIISEGIPNWKWERVDYTIIMEKLSNGYGVEVAPAAHFFIGGIKINKKYETNIAGLYACGECAGGLWGSNRIAAATTQILVQGKLAGKYAVKYAKNSDYLENDENKIIEIINKINRPFKEKGNFFKPIELKKEIQKIASDAVGLIREEKKLKSAINNVKQIRNRIINDSQVDSSNRIFNLEWKDYIELYNLVDVLELSLNSALLRKESRGEHFRTDYTEINNDKWLKNIILKKDTSAKDGIKIRTESVVNVFLKLPKGVMSYKDAMKIQTSTLQKD